MCKHFILKNSFTVSLHGSELPNLVTQQREVYILILVKFLGLELMAAGYLKGKACLSYFLWFQ